jgi:hypothetical protein
VVATMTRRRRARATECPLSRLASPRKGSPFSLPRSVS